MPDNDYRGMRWFKCDLQMQTPADAINWQGEKLTADGSNLQKLAEDYARACYESELDVIGITDHNFLGKDFIPELQKALNKLRGEYKRHITVFPGFEITADVGKGIHVLALFEQGTDLNDIDHILTGCGVATPRIRGGVLEKSTQRLPEILRRVQKPIDGGNWRGIVIVPHVFETSIFDNDQLSEWLQQEEFLNPDLLAVEVPKPVNKMSLGFQKLFGATEDCQPGWKRERPIAAIMSSDNKKLIEIGSDKRPVPNSIGYRYTWIKMSDPSIESLRQAFLDHESRIVVPDDVQGDVKPSEREKHARILSVSISNAEFLKDQEIQLSPNLNCIIGGRGTGKSTILEGLRIALKKDGESLDEHTKEKVERVRKLLKRKRGTEIEVHWRTANGANNTILFAIDENGEGTWSVKDRDVPDLSTYLSNLPLQVFSQQQLNQITNEQDNSLLLLLDSYFREELQELSRKEGELANEIRRLFTVSRQLEQNETDVRRLKQEINDLERDIEVLRGLTEDFDRYQKARATTAYISTILGETEIGGETLVTHAKELVEKHDPVNATERDWPSAGWLDEKDASLRKAKENLVREIQDAIVRYRNEIEHLYFADDHWPELHTRIENADQEFLRICAEKGASPEDIDQIRALSDSLRQKQAELSEKEVRAENLRLDGDKLSERFEQLHKIWHDMYVARKSIAQEIEGSERYINLEIDYSTDMTSFLQHWKAIGRLDGRSRIGRYWEEIGSVFHQAFIDLTRTQNNRPTHHSTLLSPWQMIEFILTGEMAIPSELETFLSSREFALDEIRESLHQGFRDSWEATRLKRVSDKVDLLLYRDRGSQREIAGRVSDGTLSDGQRNTAALMLILAKGDAPLVLDQPEDELDSNFIFHELVPMLRKMKTKRQIILVTHNANLPVNADAELVYALETKDNQGVPLAHGGLDQAKVTQAVLEIMEGSETAFKRRREKYHF